MCNFSPVQPRVSGAMGEAPMLLVDVLEDLLERFQEEATQSIPVVLLEGHGKTTALSVLQSRLDPHIWEILDGETSCEDADTGPGSPRQSAVAARLTTVRGASHAARLTLAEWDSDTCIEYLLANHPQRCASVMARIRSEDYSFAAGSPYFWQPALDLLADYEEIDSVSTAGEMLIEHFLKTQRIDLPQLVQSWDTRRGSPPPKRHVASNTGAPNLPVAFARLMRIGQMRNLVAARWIVTLLRKQDPAALRHEFTFDLAAVVAARIAQDEGVLHFLKSQVISAQESGIAVSLLVKAQPGWKPPALKQLVCRAVDLRHVQWADCQLSEALLDQSDLTGADLSGADLQAAGLNACNLSRANLAHARMETSRCTRTNLKAARLAHLVGRHVAFWGGCFDRAALVEANFRNCNFQGSSLVEADLASAAFWLCLFERANFDAANLSGTQFIGCDLEYVDFRTTQLSNTHFRKCKLLQANFEDQQLDGCNFSGARMPHALFTGSTGRNMDFSGAADLRNAGLAEVNWQACDLRGVDLRDVSFHLGSTRCGLVDSPYPSHGTRTGFYTDDYLDLSYKRPEEIRKAAIVDCDLRGANLEGVDFYLVDLRGSRYDERFHKDLVASGAILGA